LVYHVTVYPYYYKPTHRSNNFQISKGDKAGNAIFDYISYYIKGFSLHSGSSSNWVANMDLGCQHGPHIASTWPKLACSSGLQHEHPDEHPILAQHDPQHRQHRPKTNPNRTDVWLGLIFDRIKAPNHPPQAQHASTWPQLAPKWPKTGQT